MIVVTPHRGFTLMEVLISLGLFVVVAGVAVSVFVQTNDENRRQQAASGAESDAMNILETIANDVRNGHLDYEQYRSDGVDLTTAQPLEYLILRDVDNQQVIYRLNGTAVEVCVGTPGSCTSFDALHTDDTTITQLSVFVSPAADPFFKPVENADCPLGGDFEGDDPGESGVGLCRDIACWPGQIATAGYCYNPNVQPSATIVIKAQQGEGEQLSESHAQTTISTREYDR